MWPFSSTKKAKRMLVFDIGSSSVSGGIFEFHGSKKPRILSHKRIRIKYQKDLDPKRFKNEMISALGSVVDHLDDQAHGRVSGTHVFLAAPWGINQTRTISTKRDTQFVFTKAIADSMVNEELKNITDGNDKSLRDLGDARLVENKIMRVKLNGYRVHNPIGKRTQSVDITSFVGFISESLGSRIEDTIQKSFSAPIQFHSFMFALYSVFKTVFPSKDNATLIDVAGELTEVGIINEDVLEQTLSFPMGETSVIRSVSAKMKQNPEQVYSYINLHYEKLLAEKLASPVDVALTNSTKDWSDNLAKSLEKLSSENSLGNTIAITADHPMMEFFVESMSDRALDSIFSGGSPKIIPINMKSLGGNIVHEDMPHDEFLTIEGIFLRDLQ